MKKRVLITGATGLIGKKLCQLLQDKGYELLLLSRKKGMLLGAPIYQWDLNQGYIEDEVFKAPIHYIIHLAGAGIADKKWSEKRKQLIIDSRIKGIQLLANYLKQHDLQPEAFVSASAVGIYGDRGTEKITEATLPKEEDDAFLVQSCLTWERAVQEITDLGIRTVALRIGIVLSTEGGALAKMLPSYRFGLGAYFGDGQQYYSWVHIDDIAAMFLFLMEHQAANGVFNGTSPHPVTNKELAKAIARARGRKALVMPAPAAALKLAMGEMSTMLLFGSKVYPQRLEEMGFEFQFEALDAALKDLIGEEK